MAFVALLLAAFGALCYAAAAEEVLDQWTTLHGGSGQDRAYGLEAGRARWQRQTCDNDIAIMCSFLPFPVSG